ncbi:MAG: hypothetical protein RR543_05825, partial [Erysipelotrichales bacterium]
MEDRKTKLKNIGYRFVQTLSYFVRFFSGIVFAFSLFTCLLIIVIIIADQFFVNRFFASFIVNTIISSGFPLQSFTPAMWLANLRLDSFIVVAIVVVIIIIVKRLTITTIYKKIEHPFKKMFACILNLIINLCIMISVIVLFFNMMLISYINTSLESSNKETDNIDYKQRIELFSKRLTFTNKKATKELDEIMNAVNTRAINVEQLSDEDYIALATKVSILVDQKQGVETYQEHYFRNVFERAPSNLDEMIKSIHKKNDLFKWEIVEPSKAQFHMFGKKGEYNLKFISGNGLFEAVYDINGKLLTSKNNPDNMGTFNYADSKQSPQKHSIYDVLPYFIWNNSKDATDLEVLDESNYNNNL